MAQDDWSAVRVHVSEMESRLNHRLDSVNFRLDGIERQLKRMEAFMADSFAALQAAVAGEDTVVESAITLIMGLAAQIASLKPEQGAIDALAADVRLRAQALAQAVSTGTGPQPLPVDNTSSIMVLAAADQIAALTDQASIDALVASMQAQITTLQAAGASRAGDVTLMQGILAQVQALTPDPAAIATLAASVKAQGVALANPAGPTGSAGPARPFNPGTRAGQGPAVNPRAYDKPKV